VFDTNLGNLCCEIEPPQKIKKKLYRCDNRFHLDILYELVNTYDNYGIVLLSGDETRFYLISGPIQKLLFTIECNAPNKQGRGGQSQQRFDRLRLESINEYNKKILEKMKQYFIDRESNQPNIKGLVFAGPSQTKNKVAEHDMFDYRLKKILCRIETTSEITDGTIFTVITKVDDLISSESEETHAIVNQFTESIRRDDGLSIYGEKHIFYCLGHKLLQYLIVSNDYYEINKNKLDAICEKGGCEIVITTSHIIKTYGDIVGLSWYPLKLNVDDEY